MLDDDTWLVFDIVAAVVLAFAAGLLWRHIIVAHAPHDEQHID
jgi:hypothetical protein